MAARLGVSGRPAHQTCKRLSGGCITALCRAASPPHLVAGKTMFDEPLIVRVHRLFLCIRVWIFGRQPFALGCFTELYIRSHKHESRQVSFKKGRIQRHGRDQMDGIVSAQGVSQGNRRQSRPSCAS
jgi:hypothetical protein